MKKIMKSVFVSCLEAFNFDNNKVAIKMKYSLVFLSFLSLFFTFSTPQPTFAADRVYLDITSAETRKINFAVPWFSKSNAVRNTKEFLSPIPAGLYTAVISWYSYIIGESSWEA